MSGGHYNYAFRYVNDFAFSCVLPTPDMDFGNASHNHIFSVVPTPREHLALRKKFADHLKKVSDVMRIIEWADSGDMNDKDVKEALEDFFE
jgi:hypothetical protein